MAKIVLSNAARKGIQGTTSRIMSSSDKAYQKSELLIIQIRELVKVDIVMLQRIKRQRLI